MPEKLARPLKTIGRPFPKGQSGNPGGRPAIIKSIQELARAHTDDAIAALVGIMKSKDAPSAAVATAATALLDRGWGRPVQTMSIRKIRGVEDLDDDELAAIAGLSTDDRAETEH